MSIPKDISDSIYCIQNPEEYCVNCGDCQQEEYEYEEVEE
jgi:hypothetical protein